MLSAAGAFFRTLALASNRLPGFDFEMPFTGAIVPERDGPESYLPFWETNYRSRVVGFGESNLKEECTLRISIDLSGSPGLVSA